MVQLAHNVNFLSQLLKTFCARNEPQVQALDGILDASHFMSDEADDSGNSRSQDATRVNVVVNFFNWFPKGSFHPHYVAIEISVGAHACPDRVQVKTFC
jgi:hypothetical protein